MDTMRRAQNRARISDNLLFSLISRSFWLSYYLLIHSAQNLSCKLRKTAFASIVNRPQSWHDDPANSTAHVTSALQHAGEYAPCIVFDFLVFYIESTSTCICACSIAMATSWLIGLPFLGKEFLALCPSVCLSVSVSLSLGFVQPAAVLVL